MNFRDWRSTQLLDVSCLIFAIQIVLPEGHILACSGYEQEQEPIALSGSWRDLRTLPRVMLQVFTCIYVHRAFYAYSPETTVS